MPVPSTSCIDDDTLAVFAGGALDAAARARVEAHVADCNSCMEALAAAAFVLDPAGGAPEPLHPGLLGGRFELGPLIARGGMGVVHQGRDRVTGQRVAIKSLRSDLLEHGDDIRQRFEREGEVLRQLDHPNIVKMLTTVQDEERLHIVMEYVGGGCLREQLRAQAAPLPLARAVGLTLELSDALARAHHLQVIHRDIKPENVLIADDGTPRLSDFGLARVGGQGLTRTGMLLGTVSYQSPEALWGHEVDERADIWALGITLYELLAARRPFDGRHPAAIVTAILNQPLPALGEIRQELPARLLDLVERMLDRNPTSRIATMRQVGAELELVQQALVSPTRSSERKPSLRGPSVPPSVQRPEHNLPARGGLWIGRDAELLELSRLLASAQTRLVTIVGPAGIGKTHLAIEAARRLARGSAPFRELTMDPQNVALGVYFVDVGRLTSAEQVVFAIARTVGFQMAPHVEPRRQLFEYLRNRSLLLVIDNFERLLEGPGVITELVAFAPRVRVLATSRQRMGLHSETILPLAGLTEPAGVRSYTPESVAGSEAGRLFVARATELRSELALTPRMAADVARICRGLHGNPLGLLLAAGALEGAELAGELSSLRQAAEYTGLDPATYSTAEALRPVRSSSDNHWALLDEDRGEARPHLLQVELEESPDRRRALHHVIRHVWASLGERERFLLRRAQIFPDNFGLDAAQAVLGATAAELEGLARRALLEHDATSGRYRLLDSIRDGVAARALQDASDEAEQTREPFTRFYASFLNAREHALRGNGARAAAAEIGRELGNVRAAWRLMIEARQEESIERSIGALHAFHLLELSLAEGEAAFAAATATALEASEADTRAAAVAGRALASRAAFVAELGRHDEAVELARQAFALLEGSSTEHDTGPLLVTWALSLCQLRHLPEAVELGERGLERLRSAPPSERAPALALLGAQRGWLELEEARGHLKESVALQRASDAGNAAHHALPALALAEVDLGNYGEAARLFAEALLECEERGDRWLPVVCLQGLAEAQCRLGTYLEAEATARRELELVEDAYPFAAGLAHARLAEILKEQARWAEAWASAQVAAQSSNAFTCAVAKLQLADIASLRGEASEASRYWGEAIETFERLDTGRGLAAAWDGLGWAALEQEQHAVAQQYFRQAGELAIRLQLRGQAFSALAGYAASLLHTREISGAAELAGLVQIAAATDAKTRNRRLDPLLRELRKLLPSAELEAAMKRGARLDWKQALLEGV